MLRQATRSNAASIAAGHIELEVGDALKLPSPDNSFDKAFAYTLWERIDSHCCRLHLLCAHGALSSLPREFVGVLLYGGLGLGGAWRFPVLIAFGWATHVAWDLAVTGESTASYVPAWWPALCVGTDLFLAGYITAIIWKR
jgi:hypothetical protein